MASLTRFQAFIDGLAALVEDRADENRIFAEGGSLLADLVAHDDWLPAEFARSDATTYRQYLLHRDAAARFSIVSFVWGPGQETPIHDHTVWGMIGVLRGAELSEKFIRTEGSLQSVGRDQRLDQGDIDFVSPRRGDIHRVRNAFLDRVSISIHAYGGDIGTIKRHAYDRFGDVKTFVSGYSNDRAPTLTRG